MVQTDATLVSLRSGHVPQRSLLFCEGCGFGAKWQVSSGRNRGGVTVANNSIDTMFVIHYIRVVKTKLRNVTVTLEEHVARWARMEAARKETSVSRLLGGILRERMQEKDGYEGAMRRALSRKPFLKTDGHYPSREEAHD